MAQLVKATAETVESLEPRGGRRKPTPESCPLAFTHPSQHMQAHSRIHTIIMKFKNFQICIKVKKNSIKELPLTLFLDELVAESLYIYYSL